jgi:hypothetical protein
MRSLVFLSAITFLAACPGPTRFEGSAFFPGGPDGCAAKCASQPGLEMSSFIYAGEFSTACVCRSKAQAAASESDTAAAVGVVMQARAAAARQQQHKPAGR